MVMFRQWWTVAAAALMTGACASSPVVRQECVNPDVQLANVLKPLEALRTKGCTPACDSLRLELERLSLVCRDHAPTLMANAVISYDEHRVDRAQQYLDRVLSLPQNYPDAAILRARIAVEEGNLPYARHLLEQRIKLSPDHAGLRETYGATLYLARQLESAARELTLAGALGAPYWRIAYHLGLVKEAEGFMDEAVEHYTQSLQAYPGWAPAQSRLNALRATGLTRK